MVGDDGCVGLLDGIHEHHRGDCETPVVRAKPPEKEQQLTCGHHHCRRRHAAAVAADDDDGDWNGEESSSLSWAQSIHNYDRCPRKSYWERFQKTTKPKQSTVVDDHDDDTEPLLDLAVHRIAPDNYHHFQ